MLNRDEKNVMVPRRDKGVSTHGITAMYASISGFDNASICHGLIKVKASNGVSCKIEGSNRALWYCRPGKGYL